MLLATIASIVGLLSRQSMRYWRRVVYAVGLQVLSGHLFAAGGTLKDPTGDGLITEWVRSASNDGLFVAVLLIPAIGLGWLVPITLLVRGYERKPGEVESELRTLVMDRIPTAQACAQCAELRNPVGSTFCGACGSRYAKVGGSAGTPMSEAGLIGVALGLGVVSLTGASFLVPLVGAFAAWEILSELRGPTEFRNAWSVQAGHLLWIAGSSLVLGSFGSVALDVTLVGVGLTWLWIKPGAGAVSALIFYQCACAFVSFGTLAETDPSALAAHLALRVAAVTYLLLGYRAWRSGHPKR